MLVRYRKDYLGEYVVLSRELSNGRWTEQTEWVENSLEFYPTSLSAVVLSGSDNIIDPNILKNKKFTTYSTNKDTHFVVGTTQPNSVSYAKLQTILDCPEQHHLIPCDPGFDYETTLVYLSVFDGHKQVYLVGVNESPQLLDIVSSYHEVEFVKVSVYGRDSILSELQYQTNYKQISLVDFDLDITIPVPTF